MALLHENSGECIKNELDLFAVPATQTSVDGYTDVEYYPINSISEFGALEYMIPGTSDEMLDLRKTELHLQVKIVKADGTAIAADKVGPVNLFGQALFKQCDVFLNDRLITVSTNTYHYRAYLETIASYGSEASKSQLTAAMYYKDTAGKMDVADPAGANEGLTTRESYFKNSAVVDIIGMLHSDIFQQAKFMSTMIDVRVKLDRNNPAFCLMSSERDAAYKVVLTKASLFVRRVKVHPSVLEAQEAAIIKAPLRYPIKRNDIKIFNIQASTQSTSRDNLYLGQLPSHVFVSFVLNSTVSGNYTLNPFNFKNFGLRYLSLSVNGKLMPSTPFTPVFPPDDSSRVGQWSREYISLFKGAGIHYQNMGLAISRAEYPHGYTIFGFNLSPDGCTSQDYVSLIRTGSVRLEVQFASPLTNTISVVCMGVFDSMITVDKHRNITVDYL